MLFCLERAVKEVPEKGCIVFLHGFLGSSDDWIPYLDHFNDLGYRVIAIDLPGHGNSFDYEPEELFNHIPRGAHVVGYSMGGRALLYLNYLRSDWFASFTLVSTNPGLRSCIEKKKREEWEKKIILKLRNEPFDKFISDWYAHELFCNFKPPESRLKQNRELLIASFRKFSIAKLPSLWNYLLSISQPVQMVFGELDQKYMKLKRDIEKIDTRKQIRVVSVCNASHPVHLMASNQLIKYIENLTRMVRAHA